MYRLSSLFRILFTLVFIVGCYVLFVKTHINSYVLTVFLLAILVVVLFYDKIADLEVGKRGIKVRFTRAVEEEKRKPRTEKRLHEEYDFAYGTTVEVKKNV